MNDKRNSLFHALVSAAVITSAAVVSEGWRVPMATALSPPEQQTTQLKPGQTPDEVATVVGKPKTVKLLSGNLIWNYATFDVIFKAGKLVGVKMRAQPAGATSTQAESQAAPAAAQSQQKGGFFTSLKSVSGQGSQQEVATATAGSKSVGEGRRIADVTPTPADWKAVSEMERSTVSSADLAKFRSEGGLQAQARSTRFDVANKAGLSGVAGQADQVSGLGSALPSNLGKIGGFFGRSKKETSKAQQATAPFTVAEEREIGREVAAKFVAYYHVYKNDELTRYVNLVGADVAAQQDRQDISYHFAVLDSADINAFSAPAGYVFVTRGAVALCQDESELAGVLAHEVGHVAGKHVLHVLERDKTLRAGANEAPSHAPGSAYLNKMSNAVLAKVIDQGLAPTDEFNADDRGVTYAYTAGYPSAGLEQFLNGLSQVTNQGANSFWTRTHPPVDQRDQRIEQLIAAQNWTDSTRPQAADRFEVETADSSGTWTVPVATTAAAAIPTPSQPSGQTGDADDTIVSDINARLWEDATLRTLDVRVSSKGGVVTLEGSVNTQLQKAAVERTAKREKGVRRVIDQLTVSHSAR